MIFLVQELSVYMRMSKIKKHELSRGLLKNAIVVKGNMIDEEKLRNKKNLLIIRY